MTKTFQEYIDSLKNIKFKSDRELNTPEFILNALRSIEFTKGEEDQEFKTLIGSSSIDFIVTKRATDSKMLYAPLKNSVAFFRMVIKIMYIKASQIAEDKGITIEPLNKRECISYQKKLTRAVKRAYTGEGDYGLYLPVDEKSNIADVPCRSAVIVRLHSCLFQGNNPYEYKLHFNGIASAITYDESEHLFKFDKNIEAIF